MTLPLRARRYALLAALISLTLACRTSDLVIAQLQPTPTRTRVLPTFTPTPTQTLTPPPTATNTRPPTARPTARPTAIPPPPAQAAPTAFPYVYHAVLQKCEHAGDTFVKGSVYADRNNPNSKIVGALIVLSSGPDGERVDLVRTTDSYTFVLRSQGALPGNFFVWVVDPSLKRISEISPMISFNGKSPSEPGACWAAIVDFWKEPGR